MERKFTRKQALFYLGCISIGAFAGYKLKQAQNEITKNSVSAEKSLKDNPYAFEEIEIDDIRFIPLNGKTDIRYGAQDARLTQYSIANIAISADIETRNLLVDIYPQENVQFGTEFNQSANGNIVGFIYFPDKEEASATRRLVYDDDKNGNIELLRIPFGIPIQKLFDREFAVAVAGGLLSVNGNDVPTFYLPYRFKVKPLPKPFRHVGPLNA